MVEDVHLGETTKIHGGANRQESKTCRCRLGAAFPGQHDIQLCPQIVKVEYIARRVTLLRLAQCGAL